MKVTVRPLQLADYSDVSAIYKSVIEEYRAFLAEIGLHETLSDNVEIESFRFYASGQSSFVALAEDQSLGWIHPSTGDRLDKRCEENSLARIYRS
jgi:hypothetical protein